MAYMKRGIGAADPYATIAQGVEEGALMASPSPSDPVATSPSADDGSHWYSPPSGGGGATAGSGTLTGTASCGWDFACWARKAGQQTQKAGIPVWALAAGAAAVVFLVLRKKGRR